MISRCMATASPGAATFELRNPTAYPMEVYSLEFDAAYAREELLLREDASAPRTCRCEYSRGNT